MVAASLNTAGINLYYYHAPSGSPELDFLIEENGEAVIIECKSTNNRATSMKYVLANPKKYGKHKAYKYSDTNVGKGEGFDTFPLYALGYLEMNIEKMIVKPIEVENLKVPNK